MANRPVQRSTFLRTFYNDPPSPPSETPNLVDLPLEFVESVFLFLYVCSPGYVDPRRPEEQLSETARKMESLERTLTKFLESPAGRSSIQLIKNTHSLLKSWLLKSPAIATEVKRYDPVTLLANLPNFLRGYRAILTVENQMAKMVRSRSADKKLMKTRAVVWLFLAAMATHPEVSKYRIYKEIAKALNVGGESAIRIRVDRFKKDHLDEYERIEQYLKHSYPSREELSLMVLFGTTPHSKKARSFTMKMGSSKTYVN